MKIIKYTLRTEINLGTDESPDVQEVFVTKGLDWSEANEKIAKREAYNGEYTIEDDGRPEPEPVTPPDESVWDELDAAYQSGYREGVDSV